MSTPSIQYSFTRDAIIYQNQSGSWSTYTYGNVTISLSPKTASAITCNYANFHSNYTTWDSYDWWTGMVSDTIIFNGLSETHRLSAAEKDSTKYTYYYQTIEYIIHPGTGQPMWVTDRTGYTSEDAAQNAIASSHPGSYDYKVVGPDAAGLYAIHKAEIQIVIYSEARSISSVDVSSHIQISDMYLSSVNILSTHNTLTPSISSTTLTAVHTPSVITGVAYLWEEVDGTGDLELTGTTTSYTATVRVKSTASQATSGWLKVRVTASQDYNGIRSVSSTITIYYQPSQVTATGSISLVSTSQSSITIGISLSNIQSATLIVTDAVSLSQVSSITVANSSNYTINNLVTNRNYYFELKDGTTSLNYQTYTTGSGVQGSPSLTACQATYESENSRIVISGLATNCNNVTISSYINSISQDNFISTMNVSIASLSNTQFSRYIEGVSSDSTYVFRIIPMHDSIAGTNVDITCNTSSSSGTITVNLGQIGSMSVNGHDDSSNVVRVNFQSTAPTLEGSNITISTVPSGAVSVVITTQSTSSITGGIRRMGYIDITPMRAGKFAIRVSCGNAKQESVGKILFDWFTNIGSGESMTLESNGNIRVCYADEWNVLVRSTNNIKNVSAPTVVSGSKITASVVSDVSNALVVPAPRAGGIITANFFLSLRNALNTLINNQSDPQFSS